MKVVSLLFIVSLACSSSPASTLHQDAGKRQPQGSKPIGRFGEHVLALSNLFPYTPSYPIDRDLEIQRMTRAKAAEGIWSFLLEGYKSVVKSMLNSEEYMKTFYGERVPEHLRLSNQPSVRRFAGEYWRLELLVRELTPELLDTDVTQDEIDESLRWIRSTFGILKVELIFPNGDWFPDVPEGHWADTAIHNLRRAGILYGYPDGSFRP